MTLTLSADDRFEGQYYHGEGDLDYLRILDTSYRMFWPDPELQNISMLYAVDWNGFVEGPTWGAWWIQNSYGTTYAALPFYSEPYTTFLQNSQNLWFSQMGDGRRKGMRNWVAPDGGLCDAAAPGLVIYKQGDGRRDIHDWGMEFTAAGVVMQAELLLINRDKEALAYYLPLLERSAEFIESRRDPKNNLFLAGPAGNLLAPSYAGWKQADGTYRPAYLTGLSVTYIAALDRLIELEKTVGRMEKVNLYGRRRDLARQGLAAVTTDEGYLIKYLDPDGTRHGVYGAPKHGYFEAVCNHDAVAFHVTDEAQSRRIFEKMLSLPELRPHNLVLTNYPGLDDMYNSDKEWLWSFGTWVNGGHWTTCEARMVLAYYQFGAYENARRSFRKILDYAKKFRMDNNLVEFGNAVYQPKEPINYVYDTWGSPAAMIRGLFEYIYRANHLELRPHIPTGITQMDQLFPIRFGDKRLYLSTTGQGDVTKVLLNGKAWKGYNSKSVLLPYKDLPDTARIQIVMGNASPRMIADAYLRPKPFVVPVDEDPFWDLSSFYGEVSGNRIPLRIGADSHGANGFLGAMKRIRMTERALPPAEIGTLAGDSENPEQTTAAVADYRLTDPFEVQTSKNRETGYAMRTVGQTEVVEEARLFSGDGYLETRHEDRFMFKGDYTLEAWIRTGPGSQNHRSIVSKRNVGMDNGYLLDITPDNFLRFTSEQGVIQSEVRLLPDTWIHVAATLQTQGNLCLYIDGKQVAVRSSVPAESPGLFRRIGGFYRQLTEQGLTESYEARHARLVLDYLTAMHSRKKMLAEGTLKPLAEDVSQKAADRSYKEAVLRLAKGLDRTIDSYEKSTDSQKKRIYSIWLSGAKNTKSTK